ncbi:hypothetical protein cand_007330 [Cryptosporidium andersoni]|uniref:Uncharacterized protein n=1 Tax=Cryptosporidium andersoni TaxID=117008 RepID=A0A1J4MPN4_9CRYT|nr:hypothetical protein cand_007330 [Cryptosporidium andersoni]
MSSLLYSGSVYSPSVPLVTMKNNPNNIPSNLLSKARVSSNFKQGNRRWFKAKKSGVKFTPQKNMVIGKKVALNASVGVIWMYEPGLLIAEELVSPCFGVIFYYPNIQVSVSKGERFLGILCDARVHKPISDQRFKWYVAMGNNLTFTPRKYVYEGAYIKEGREIGYLSRPAKTVGKVAIKARARCSGYIILCKSGPVVSSEEFLRISCDQSTNDNNNNNNNNNNNLLTDETHSSLLLQSDFGESITSTRGLAQISTAEAELDGENIQLPQIMNPLEPEELLNKSSNIEDNNETAVEYTMNINQQAFLSKQVLSKEEDINLIEDDSEYEEYEDDIKNIEEQSIPQKWSLSNQYLPQEESTKTLSSEYKKVDEKVSNKLLDNQKTAQPQDIDEDKKIYEKNNTILPRSQEPSLVDISEIHIPIKVTVSQVDTSAQELPNLIIKNKTLKYSRDHKTSKLIQTGQIIKEDEIKHNEVTATKPDPLNQLDNLSGSLVDESTLHGI